MRAVSLFSGAGGFEIGFDRAGIQTVLQAEQDPWCLQVLKRHWPQVERVTDVRNVSSRRSQPGGQRQPLPHAERRGWHEVGCDLVYGGFPCQDVSVAGNRAGLGGARSGLWSEFHRVLRELRPRWCVIENVPGLLSSNGGRDFLSIIMGLEELGFGWAYAILDARWFGVPQRRRRVFIVGCLGNPDAAAAVLAVCESCGGHPAAGRETGQGTPNGAANGIAGTLGSPHGNTRADQAWTGQLVTSHAGHEARSLMARQERNNAFEDNLLIANGLRASDGHHGHSSPRGDGADNLIAFDWQASAGNDDSWRGKGRQHVVRSGDYAGANSATRVDAVAGLFGVRRLTPLECNRLQGFPDDWDRWMVDGKEIPDSHRYRLMGNAVCVPVAEWIGHRLQAVDRLLEPVS